MAKSPKSTVHEKRAKDVQPFVDFKVNVKTKAGKARVKRYYEKLYGSEGNPGIYNRATDVPIRPQGKAFDAIRESEGQPKHKHITHVFVETIADPLNPDKLLKPRFKRKGGKVIKTNFDVSSTFYPFRVKATRVRELEDAFIRDAKRIFKEAPDIRSWFIKCGKRQMSNAYSPRGVIDKIRQVFGKYQDTTEWLAGLIALEYQTTAALSAFIAERDKLRKGKSGRKARRRHRR